MSSTSKFKREIVEVVRDVVEAAGGEVHGIEDGGKHPFVAVSMAGQRHRLTFSCSPRRQGTALMKTRSAASRLVRKIQAAHKAARRRQA